MNKILICALLVLVLVTGCAPGSDIEVDTPDTIELSSPGPNPQLNQPDADGDLAGFPQGFWHGLISPVTVIGSFINPVMQMYEVHNNGSEYQLGFLIGVAIIFLFLGILGGRRRW